MPLTKYYCDYCDKQFRDTPSARKKHLQSLQHQRAKALWYASSSHHHEYPFPSRPDKGTCNAFLRTGFCRYGDACRYFHPKQNNQPSAQAIPDDRGASLYPQRIRRLLFVPIVIDTVGDSEPKGSVNAVGMNLTLANLPPSLMPPPEGGYPPMPFIDWG